MRTIRSLVLTALAFLLPCCAMTGSDPRTAADAPDHSPPVVYIQSNTGYSCSAVVYERDVLMTAGHCLPEGHRTIHAFGFGQLAEEDSYWRSETADIGLVFLKAGGFKGPIERIRIGDVPSPFADTWVRGFGCALHDKDGAKIRLETRPVINLGFSGDGQLGFLGKVCHGDSGGAYFDSDGRLLGVTSKGYTDADDNPTAGSAVLASEALEGLLLH